MIRKLRKKFVILSTISLLLLLGIIVVSSNFLTYRELVDKADIVLDMIVENGGRPMHLLPPEKKEIPREGMSGERGRFFGKSFCHLKSCMRRDFSLRLYRGTDR